MPLFLTHHPWPGGMMDRDHMLNMVRLAYEDWQADGVHWHGYLGTRGNGEGWCMISAPSREALVRMFHKNQIPWLYATEVWQIGEQDLDLATTAGAGASQPI